MAAVAKFWIKALYENSLPVLLSLRSAKPHLPFALTLSLPSVSSALTERRGNQSPQPVSETLPYKRGVPSAKPFPSAVHAFIC